MATISFTTKFDLTTNTIVFTDTTDWSGQGIALADVNMDFRVVAPSGTPIYDNSDFSDSACDIWIANDLVSQQTISLPLVLTEVEPGEYTIIATVYNSDTDESYTTTNTYTYDFVEPEVCIRQTIDCITPRFTSVDATNYVVSGVTPTIVRTHKLYYPEGNEDDATFTSTASATLITGVFYPGTQTTTISTSLTYEFSDGLTVFTLATGRKEDLVDCAFICSVICCINTYKTATMAQKGVNEAKFSEMSRTFALAVSLVQTAEFNIQCGLPDNVNDLLSIAMRLIDCTADCNCGSPAPSRVTGLGGIVNETVVVSKGSPVTVTSSVAGSITTYTIGLSDSAITKFNNSYNSVVAAGNNITVSVATAVDGTKTYTVNGLKTIVTSTGGTITVTPSGPNGGVTTYNIEANPLFFSAQVTPPLIATTLDIDINLGDKIAVTEVYDGWTNSFDGTIWTVPVTGFYNLNAWLYASVNQDNNVAFGTGYVTIGITSNDGTYLFASGTQQTDSTTFFLHITAKTDVAYLTAGTELVIQVLNHTTQDINAGDDVTGRVIKWSAELIKEIV
jgi:hypothetical protein